MTGTVAARPLRWPDIPALVALENELFAEDAWTAASWWSELAGRPRRVYVVIDDAEGVVAYAGLDHGGEAADIMTVAVAARARGTGLGSALLAELEAKALAGGAAYLMLEVRDDNESAKNLYARRGFEILSVRRRYYQPGDIDALVLRKRLVDPA